MRRLATPRHATLHLATPCLATVARYAVRDATPCDALPRRGTLPCDAVQRRATPLDATRRLAMTVHPATPRRAMAVERFGKIVE